MNVMQQSACLLVNPNMVNNFAFVFNYTLIDLAVDL